MLSLSKYEGRADGAAQDEVLMLSLSKYEGRADGPLRMRPSIQVSSC